MRKIYITILSFFTFLLVSSPVFAQPVRNYVFAPTSATYTPITGGTAFVSDPDDFDQNLDDDWDNVPLGFNFTFGGVVYTRAIITTNGAISLSNDPDEDWQSSNSNQMANDYGLPVIAPFWDDDGAQVGSIVYLTSGAVGSRTFSVEFIGTRVGSYQADAPLGTYKVTLREGSNQVSLAYHDFGPVTEGFGASIGLNDLTSFLSVTPGGPATASNSEANNDIVTSVGITNTTVYNFFPPSPCIPGSLVGGTATTSVDSVCGGLNFTLNVIGSSGGTGLTYEWQSSPDGVTWTPITGSNTDFPFVTSQTGTTHYRRKVRCNTTDAFSTEVIVNANAIINCYCFVDLTNSPNFGDAIDNVVVTSASGGTLTQASTGDFDDNYTRYDNAPLDLARSTNNTIAITFGYDSRQHSAVWIDFNQNGVFEASENVALSTAVAGSNATVTYNFVIPAGATLGRTRLRVRGGSDPDDPYTPAGACTETPYGETEDYLVNIIPAPSCVSPQTPVISALQTTTATVTWVAASPAPGSGYQWEVRTSGAAGSGATGLAVSGSTSSAVNSANITGLTENTVYQVYVRSVCTAGALYSTWTPIVGFQTPCSAITVFPYYETFETTSPTRACWRVDEYLSGNTSWDYLDGSGGFTGTSVYQGELNAAFHSDNFSEDATKFVSPAMNLSAFSATGARMDFAYINPNYFGQQDTLRIYYKTSASGTWTMIPGAEYFGDQSDWKILKVTLPNVSSTYYVGFEGISGNGGGIGIDSLVVKKFPACPEVDDASAIGSGPNKATVTFTSAGGAAFIVEYGAPGFTPGLAGTAGTGGTLAFGTGSPLVVNGLTPSTSYDMYIRRVCTPGSSYSENILVHATTLCAATNIPYTMDFTGAPVPNVPACTSVQDLNGATTWTTYDPPANYGFNGTVLRYLYNFTGPGNDWFYLQGLNLTAGTTYQLSYKYGAQFDFYTESMKVAIGTSAVSSAMTTVLRDYPEIQGTDAPYAKLDRLTFTVPTNGVYYIGFQAYSIVNQEMLLLDSINVKLLPLVDVGISGVSTSLPICPTPSTAISASLHNYNLGPVDFSVYPVTVTATISGAGSGTVSTVVNTGTLAAGEDLAVDLPAFPFNTAGTYDISIASSNSTDVDTSNNAFTVSQIVNPSPTAPVITATATDLCIGSTASLTASSIGALYKTFGTQESQNSLFEYPSPYSVYYGGQRMQMLVRADELTAQGFTAGTPIEALSFNVASRGNNWGSATTADENFRVSIGATTLTELEDFQGGLTVVVPAGSFTPQVGFDNTHVFSTPFVWDGTSNLIVETTFSNDVYGTSADGIVGYSTNTPFQSTLIYRRDNFTPAAIAAGAVPDVSTTLRPDFRLRTTGALPVTWTPTTGLFTDADATIPYTADLPLGTVYAQPDATTTYTATASSAVGCPAEEDITINVHTIPVVTIAALPSRICLSDELIPLTATPAGGTWTGIGVSGSNFAPVNTALGTYTLGYTYTDQFGCSAAASVAATVVDCPERRVLLRDNAVILYPNPNDGRFNIRVNSELYNRLSMKVYTAGGAIARTQEFSGLAFGRVIPVDLTTLPSGVYIVHFYYNAGNGYSDKSFKVIVGR